MKLIYQVITLKILVYNYTKLRKAAKDEIFGTTRHYFKLSVSSLILGVQAGRSQEETKQTQVGLWFWFLYTAV